MAWSDAARQAAAAARKAHVNARNEPRLTPAQARGVLMKGQTIAAHHAYHGSGFYGKNQSGRTKFFSGARGGAATLAKIYAGKK